MKPLFYSIIGIALIVGCITQKKVNYDKPREVPKQKLIPPGTIWLRDSTFMDITEVRNLDWLEFMWWCKWQELDLQDSILPDTLCFDPKSLYYDANEMTWNYLRHPAFRDYPAVGITEAQAEEYCRWRTQRVNEFLSVKYEHISWDSARAKKCTQYVEYRLPSKEEWEYASAASLDYGYCPLGYVSLVDDKNMPVSITAESRLWYPPKAIRYDFGTHSSIMSAGEAMHEVNSGSPNAFGIYNLLGNVSEIIPDSCFKGLNFEMATDGSTFRLHPEKYGIGDSTANGYDYRYTFRNNGAEPWLGFRCVCIVKQFPK